MHCLRHLPIPGVMSTKMPSSVFASCMRAVSRSGCVVCVVWAPLRKPSAEEHEFCWRLKRLMLTRYPGVGAGHSRWVWDCVFSVDAAYLVSASSDCTAKLWDLASGEAIRTYNGHHKAIVCCALNDSAIEGRENE